jgi:hypothetical protein
LLLDLTLLVPHELLAKLGDLFLERSLQHATCNSQRAEPTYNTPTNGDSVRCNSCGSLRTQNGTALRSAARMQAAAQGRTRRHRGCRCLLWAWQRHGMAWYGMVWAAGCGRACAPLMASTIGACCIRERPMACDARSVASCVLHVACCMAVQCDCNEQEA